MAKTMMRIRVGFLIFFLFAAFLIVSSVSSEEQDSDDESLVPLFTKNIYSNKFERYGIQIVIIIHESYTRVGVEKNGKAEIILHIPNSISFSPNGTALIGDLAGDDNPPNPVLHLKHLLRRKFDDPEVQREIGVSPHKIVNREGKPHIQFGDQVFSPEDLLAMFVRNIKGLAEDRFRRRIRKAIFVVPDCFDYEGRQAIEEVAVSMGFEERKTYFHHLLVLCGHSFCNENRRDKPIELVFHLGESSWELNIWGILCEYCRPEHLASVMEEIDMKAGFLEEKTARAMVERGLKTAQLNASNVTGYVITGGGATKLRRLFKELFEGKEAFEQKEGLDHDEALTIRALELYNWVYEEFSLFTIAYRSVGVETLGGVMTRTIGRERMTPLSQTDMFTTSRDNQTAVEIKVLIGDRRLAKDCDMLGTFRLTGIRPAPRGVPRVEISFRIDKNNIFTINATEKDSNISSSYIVYPDYHMYDASRIRLEEIEHEETVDEEDRISYIQSRISLLST